MDEAALARSRKKRERGVDMAASSNIGARDWATTLTAAVARARADERDLARRHRCRRRRDRRSQQVIAGPALTMPYPEEFRERLRSVLGGIGPVAEVEDELTRLHADGGRAICRAPSRNRASTSSAFTVTPSCIARPSAAPGRSATGRLLARRLGLDVVADFRSADVAAGGEGAPLAPLFHAALAATLPKPLAILNIGGVANVTWIGDGSGRFSPSTPGPATR